MTYLVIGAVFQSRNFGEAQAEFATNVAGCKLLATQAGLASSRHRRVVPQRTRLSFSTTKMSHRADASNTLDDRGYSGPLIRGQNPASLIEEALRNRITQSLYWKEQCFGLNAATLLDRAVEVTYIGGTYGVGMRPTPFICLLFKLLTLVPDPEIVLEYLNNAGDEWKYVRALAAFYVRLTFEPDEVYKTLEPLLLDSRKLRRRRKEEYTLTHMDDFVDELLNRERTCGTSLWKLPGRQVLEDLERLDPRESPLQEELDKMDEEDEEMQDADLRNGDGSASENGRSPSLRSMDDSDGG